MIRYFSAHGWYRSAFTLIEMMIVASVVAILAAALYPYFASATLLAEENSHREQLGSIRRQIQLYRVDHGGGLPNLIHGWDALTKPSIYNGRTVGPYLRETPRNHRRSKVIDATNAADAPVECGFVYDYRGGAGTGMIWATNGSGKKLRSW